MTIHSVLLLGSGPGGQYDVSPCLASLWRDGVDSLVPQHESPYSGVHLDSVFIILPSTLHIPLSKLLREQLVHLRKPLPLGIFFKVVLEYLFNFIMKTSDGF